MANEVKSDLGEKIGSVLAALSENALLVVRSKGNYVYAEDAVLSPRVHVGVLRSLPELAGRERPFETAFELHADRRKLARYIASGSGGMPYEDIIDIRDPCNDFSVLYKRE